MGKLTRRILAVLSGTIINVADGGGATSDMLPGDEIGVYRVRGGGAPVLLTRKFGGAAQFTIPAALSTIHDALALELSVRAVFRTVDEAAMSAAQRSAILAREAQPGAVIGGSDENPWA
jgi:hypothetical protein